MRRWTSYKAGKQYDFVESVAADLVASGKGEIVEAHVAWEPEERTSEAPKPKARRSKARIV
jgi:hypothetical protein